MLTTEATIDEPLLQNVPDNPSQTQSTSLVVEVPIPKTAMLPPRASVRVVLPEDNRLKKLLRPDSPPEEIKTARHFLGSLGKANLEDVAVLNKVRECIGILQPHITSDEQSTLASLLDKANMLPSLQQATHRTNDEVERQLAQRANLE